MAVKKGSQTPTRSLYLPYKKTAAADALKLYKATGRKPQKWQSDLLKVIMGKNSDGLWTHVKFGYSVPRRNGKSEILMMRMLAAIRDGERTLYTAHRTTTSHGTWEKTCALLSAAGLVEGEDYKTVKQFGLERIISLISPGVINFRTRSSKGGLGEGYDLLIIDEAQEYTDDQETALKYVVSDSVNPQTIYTGTPPTVVSSGTVFTQYRENCLSGDTEDSGWSEWSVDEITDPYNTDAWYKSNPSLGVILTERKIRSEIGPDELDFNIQRLGVWVKYDQKSAITEDEWNALCITPPTEKELQGGIFVGIKFGHDGKNVSLSVAVRLKDNRIFVECLKCMPARTGVGWVLDILRNLTYTECVIDGSGMSQVLISAMRDQKLKPPIICTTGDVITSHAIFEQCLEAQSLTHAPQPSLSQSVTHCEHRPIGNSGGFGYSSLKEDTDVSLLESVVLAAWQCNIYKPKRKQRTSY